MSGSPHRSDLESLRRVWALARPLRGAVALGILFRFLQSMALGLSYGVVVGVVAGLAEGRPMTTAWAWQATGLMAASLAGQLLFSYLSTGRVWTAGYQVAGQLRLAMLDHLRRLPMGFHLARHRGDTVTVLTADMQMVEVFFADALPRIAQALGLPLVMFGFLLARDWAVALAAASPVAAAVPLLLWSSRRLARLGVRRQDAQAEAGARMVEFVQGIAVIRAFNRVARGCEDFRAALDAFRAIAVRMVVTLTLPIVAVALIVMLGAPLTLWVAGERHAAGVLPAGTLLTTLVLLLSLYAPLTALIGVMETTRIADAALTRMDRIMRAHPLPEPPVPCAAAGFAVRFDRVEFAYTAGRPVLRGVSFTVPERTMTAIVGPSGAGKSTILGLLARFWDVSDGAVTIGGADLRAVGQERLNALITVVFQDVYLFAGTIRDNIAFGRPGAGTAAVEAAARAAQAHGFITALPDGYDTRVGEGGAALSGGERQRVAIARAILKDAPIVLLDEATASVDASNERAIQAALARLAADKTLIVVAHRLSTIQAADQILVLEDGAVAERGRHAALMEAGGLYARLWHRRAAAAGWRIG